MKWTHRNAGSTCPKEDCGPVRVMADGELVSSPPPIWYRWNLTLRENQKRVVPTLDDLKKWFKQDEGHKGEGIGDD